MPETLLIGATFETPLKSSCIFSRPCSWRFHCHIFALRPRSGSLPTALKLYFPSKLGEPSSRNYHRTLGRYYQVHKFKQEEKSYTSSNIQNLYNKHRKIDLSLFMFFSWWGGSLWSKPRKRHEKFKNLSNSIPAYIAKAHEVILEKVMPLEPLSLWSLMTFFSEFFTQSQVLSQITRNHKGLLRGESISRFHPYHGSNLQALH